MANDFIKTAYPSFTPFKDKRKPIASVAEKKRQRKSLKTYNLKDGVKND